MTPQEAKDVKLPIFRLDRRIKEIGRLASESAPIMNVGWAPGRHVITRRGLVKLAEAEHNARFQQEVLSYAQEHDVDMRQASYGVITGKLNARLEELRGDNNGEDI